MPTTSRVSFSATLSTYIALIVLSLLSSAALAAAADPNLPKFEHVGYEELIAGPNADPNRCFVPPDKFSVGRVALSGDGQAVWFYVFWDSVATRPADWIRVYRVAIDGSGLAQAKLSGFDSPVQGGGFLVTNRDGSMAAFEMYSERGPRGGLAARTGSRFVRLTPGGTSSTIYDADPVANGRGTPYVSNGRGVRVDDAGANCFWCDGENLWRVPTAGGKPEAVITVAHLNFYGPWNPFTGGSLHSFDIDAGGDAWAVLAAFTDPQTKALRWEIVTARGALPRTTQGLNAPNSKQLAVPIHMSDDGKVVAYAEANGLGLGAAFVRGGGQTIDLRTAAPPTGKGVGNVVLADNGQLVYGEITGRNDRYPMLFDLKTSRRHPVGSTRFQRALGGLHDWQLSDDGRTIVASWNARAIGSLLDNIYVLHDGAVPPEGFPAISDASVRYDEPNDALIVRAVATAAGGLERVYVLPFKDGVEPEGFVPEAQNPLNDIRWGGGVNFSTVLAPVKGQPNTYELAIRLGGKKRFVDDSYSLRIVAVERPGRRTAFADIRLGP
jgi:hypothetical protein